MTKRPEDMHRADVKAALEKRGFTLTSIALAHGYHVTAPGKALRQPWAAMERIIASYLDTTPEKIWPSRYDANGRPLRWERWPSQRSTVPLPRNIKKRKAA